MKFATAYLAVDKLNIGYVQYQRSSVAIPLFFVGEVERSLSEDRPAEVTSTWQEVFGQKKGGRYTVISQGANIYGFAYRSASGKVFNFKYNADAVTSDYGDCKW
ncbi:MULTISPECIES: hypothetical protein [unclassified Pseudomonas]|uniref:hypothetical protein n=1 Tax=unclassified Pseudomonas TaxID=196821 RepID=UPI001111B7EF|nr:MULTISPECIES: hypothetical protein [unclassified Pseudomonas]